MIYISFPRFLEVNSRVLLAGKLRLDSEGVGTKVITLCLEEVGREVLGAVSVVE